MHILDPLEKDYQHLCAIFERIYHKNAVALLGAGASITNNQYLSAQLIQLYEAKILKSFGTEDIIQFVDILQETPGLMRMDFDTFVVDQLKKLEPNDGHRIFVTIPWKQIITTNFDTLVEEAYDWAYRNKTTHFNLHVVRNKSQLNSLQSNGEITYIKLNGCKTDLSLYPLIFSTQDFNNQATYYKRVVSSYSQFSNEILFISFGYSFTDKFSDYLLDKIANSDIREKRILYCVDPVVNENRLDYLKSKQIVVIKMTFEDFFMAYKKWFEKNNHNYIRTLQRFTTPQGIGVKLDTHSRLYLDNNILQLKDDYKVGNKIKKYDFYNGEEPNYQVIIDNYDVVRIKGQEKVIKAIENSFGEHTRTSIPKLLLIQGDFGTGKTTFTLRAINEYLKRSQCTIAFEIVNPLNLKRGYISKLIESASATQYIFYCDNIETDSVFKSFLDLRVQLASDQNGDIKIVFVSSIRENILEKFLNQTRMNISNHSKIAYNPVYSDEELQILVENLKDVGLVKYRDVTEKDSLVSTIRQNYTGDSFITLYKLIEGGAHYRLLESAYDELSANVKIAFKYTALVHRFNMLCPVAVIKNAIKNTNWNEFTENVVKGDGKGILFQVTKSSTKNEPDLYFKTKHPLIAEALIERFLKNNERNALYKNIFESLIYSDANAGFIVDLIKNIRNKDSSISKGQVENYFEIARKEFESSPHFMLAYVTNLEKSTDSKEVLQKCLKDITFLESTLEKRNHRLTHRKGSLCFKIARTLFRIDRENLSVKEWVYEAEEWFDIKKRMDPLSEYSYLDYFNLLIWKLRNINLNSREKLDTLKTLNVLFDEAYRTLSSNTDAIDSLFEEYNSVAGNNVNGSYLEFLLEQYQEPSTRSSAAMLLYYYYERVEEYGKCDQLFDEIVQYSDDKDVVNFLFKEYGRNLHLVNNRVKFFELIGKNDYLKEESQLRYYYFSAISEFYNFRWADGWENLNKLKNERSYNLNPDFFLSWRNENSEDEIFDGEIIRDRTNKKVKILSPFFKSFNLVKGNYGKYQINQPVRVRLKFFLDGVKAEIFTGEVLTEKSLSFDS